MPQIFEDVCFWVAALFNQVDSRVIEIENVDPLIINELNLDIELVCHLVLKLLPLRVTYNRQCALAVSACELA